MFDTIEKAIHGLIHDRKGGAVQLAPQVNMNPGTLANKANPAMVNHHLTVKEAVAIQKVTKDFRVLAAEAAALNHAIVPLGNFEGISDVEILTAYANYHAKIGKTSGIIAKTLNDHRVTRQEYRAVHTEFFHAVGTGLEFLSRMEALIDEHQ
jgi:hypothetical protein